MQNIKLITILEGDFPLYILFVDKFIILWTEKRSMLIQKASISRIHKKKKKEKKRSALWSIHCQMSICDIWNSFHIKIYFKNLNLHVHYKLKIESWEKLQQSSRKVSFHSQITALCDIIPINQNFKTSWHKENSCCSLNQNQI